MTKRAKEMALDEVTPGMVLSEDLLTPRGKVILPKDTTLTDLNLKSLRRYEIEKLPIFLSDDMSATEDAAEKASHQQRIESLFRNSANDKAGNLLRQYVTLFRTEAN